MSKIIGDSFKLLGKGALFLGRGYVLKKEEGARFSNKAELKEIFSPRNRGLLIDGVSKRISEKDSLTHIAVIAKSGFGKTTSYIVPNIIDRIEHGSSLVVLDPSRELFHMTQSYAKKHGYKVLLLDPTDASGMRFNPYYGLGYDDMSDIRSISTSLVLSKYGNDKEPIWNDGAISLIYFLAKCLSYKQETITIPKIYSLLLKFGASGEKLDDWVSDIEHPVDTDDCILHDEWDGIISTQDKMLASYSTIAKTALNSVSEDTVSKVLSGNDFRFKDFRKKKTVLYLSFPSHKQKDYQFVIDVFYTRLFSEMMVDVPTKKDIVLYCLLDEFGSSYIKDFELIATNIRRHKVSLSLVMQSISQLESRYGKVANEIKGGIGSYIVFAGADYVTAEEISKSIGKRTFIGRENLTDIVNKRDEKNLMNPDQIRTLDDDQIVFLSKNRFASVLSIVPHYKNSRLSRKLKQP